MNKNEYKNIIESAKKDISSEINTKATEILTQKRVAVFIVAYNAEKFLESVVSRIPENIAKLFAEIFVIDDSSKDSTYSVAESIKHKYSEYNFNIYKTPFNRGYGGNQKLGYIYSIKKNYDYVILLHGDGQYAPEYLPLIIASFESSPDAVFASRMYEKDKALKGGMPFYKWCGNQVLTYIENKMLDLNLSEFHTGFRAYNVKSLKRVPFEHNSDDFHFDTEIIIQGKYDKWSIKEVSIPTFYGTEKCNVNGIKYAFNCIKSVIRFRLVKLGIYYKRNFDLGLFEGNNFYFKKSKYSLHQYVLSHQLLSTDKTTIEIGNNKGLLSKVIRDKVKEHKYLNFDNNNNFEIFKSDVQYDLCISLDLIEHLEQPEMFLIKIFKIIKPNGKLLISTPNVGYLPVRISLLFGNFNYSKRGILDMTHKRLWTIKSFKKMLNQYGFKVNKVTGFAPPFTDLISNKIFFRIIEKIHYWLSNVLPGIFAYNFLIEAARLDSVYEIFEKTINKKGSVLK